MVTANVIHRTFMIDYYGDYVGTAFTIDIDNKQYLVTAQHLVENCSKKDNIKILHNNQWKDLAVTLVGHGGNDFDISVFALNILLSPPNLPLEPTLNGLIFGQDIYFLGYPYKLFADIFDNNYPLAFIKKGIVSCIIKDKYEITHLYLDAYDNPGFSGGPVVFKIPGDTEFRVAGVIAKYKTEKEPIYDKEDEKTEFAYEYNTGITIAYGINHAIDIIRNNPIGYIIK